MGLLPALWGHPAHTSPPRGDGHQLLYGCQVAIPIKILDIVLRGNANTRVCVRDISISIAPFSFLPLLHCVFLLGCNCSRLSDEHSYQHTHTHTDTGNKKTDKQTGSLLQMEMNSRTFLSATAGRDFHNTITQHNQKRGFSHGTNLYVTPGSSVRARSQPCWDQR